MAQALALAEGSVLHGDKEYHILKKLGMGGCGFTYLAEATFMDGNIPQVGKYCLKEFFISGSCTRDAAGKVVFGADDKQVRLQKEAFKNEAKNLEKFNQVPGIVPVNEIFEDNDTVYYVMKYLEGRTLENAVSPSQVKTESKAKELIAVLANALGELHAQYTTHLDVKPENVMLVPVLGGKEQPVLIDFGLCTHYDPKTLKPQGTSFSGTTDGYAPIEQYAGISEFSPSADIYALAATLFFMLTGQVPRKASEVNEEYLRQALGAQAVSASVTDAIVYAMRRDAAMRTQTVKQFMTDLGLVTGKKTEDIRATTGGSTQNWKKWGGIAAGVLAVLFLMGALIGGEDNPDPDPHKTDPNSEVQTTTTSQSPSGPQNTTTTSQSPSGSQNTTTTSQSSSGSQNTTTTSQSSSGSQNTTTTSQSSSGSQNTTPTEERPQPAKPTTLDLGYAKWKGGVKNGKPHGKGTMTFTQSHIIDSFDPNCNQAQAGDSVEGIYVDGHLDNGTWHSQQHGDKFLLIGSN